MTIARFPRILVPANSACFSAKRGDSIRVELPVPCGSLDGVQLPDQLQRLIAEFGITSLRRLEFPARVRPTSDRPSLVKGNANVETNYNLKPCS